MTGPTFQALGPYTTTVVMDDMRKLIWLAVEMELKIVDVRVRQKLAAARALYEQVFEEHGGKLGPCPWAKGAPERVGTANPGIV